MRNIQIPPCATRPEPFVGLVIYWRPNFYRITNVSNNNVETDIFTGDGRQIRSGIEFGRLSNHILLGYSELWPGEPNCPPVPINLWPTADENDDGIVHWYSDVDFKWRSHHRKFKDMPSFMSTLWQPLPRNEQIELGPCPSGYVFTNLGASSTQPSPTRNYNTTCPICQSKAEDLVFSIYCSKKDCPNFHG